jgi:hypothetical protein
VLGARFWVLGSGGWILDSRIFELGEIHRVKDYSAIGIF